VADTATSSWIDFGCKKLMLIMAILAAVLVVVVVATGGAALGALIAAGAIAGGAGAAFGAVVGALICGQKAAAARKWLSSKSDMIIQGQHAITGDRQMKCMLFNETITFAPEIKNWWQAVSLGGANYLGEILKGMMYGAAIGATGGVISGGPAVLGQFGVSNVAANWLATWSGWGLGLRGLVTAQSVLEAYGKNGQVSAGDVIYHGVLGMETGTLHSVKKIVTGNGTMTDVIGVGLWFIPAHARNQESRTRSKESRTRNEEGKSEEAKNEEARNEEGRNEENPQARGKESEAPRQEGEFEAFEEGKDLGNNSEHGAQPETLPSVPTGYKNVTRISTRGIEEQARILAERIPGLTEAQARIILEEAFKRDSSAVFGGSRVRGNHRLNSDLDVGFGNLSKAQAGKIIKRASEAGPLELEKTQIVPDNQTPRLPKITTPEEFFQRSGVRESPDPRAGENYNPSGSITATPNGEIIIIPPQE
jgi:hypothetical protein